ncbi:MAG: sugar phosphate nucleotidyltransferase [bacterium]
MNDFSIKESLSKPPFQAVILAAGESSRFWPLSKKHKSLLRIAGKPLLYWTIRNLSESGVEDIIIVTGPGTAIKEEFAEGKDLGVKISYAIQEKPLGTGNALFQAKSLIKEPFILLHPVKFYIKEIIKQFREEAGSADAEAFLVAAPTDNPKDYGVLEFSEGKIVKIREDPLPGEEPSSLRTLGIYFLTPRFFEYYAKVDASKEDSLIGALNLIIKEKKAGAITLEKDPSTVKYPWNALEVIDRFLKSDLFVPKICQTAKIGKNVVINGEIYIGENTIIGDNTVINGPCFIGDNCQIGPSNVLNGPLDLEAEVVTRAFTEIKHSLVGKGTHIHSGYFGNAVIGENCRFGAGFVSANRRFDRQNVFSTVKGKSLDTKTTFFSFAVGDNTKFGIHVSTLPGVLIGSNCAIGPHSLVRENIEDNTLFYAVFNETKKKRAVE